jgi:hypothetical protein
MDKVNGETGIDCGGPNCKPCGGDAQCSNGIKDGDETDVDCGGSCQPCEIYCKGQVIYNGLGLTPGTIVIVADLRSPAMSQVSNIESSPSHISNSDIIDPLYTDPLPKYTSVSNFIEASNSHVNSGEVVTFKSAGRISLKNGFSAKSGSKFIAKYETCAKCKKMQIYSYPYAISGCLNVDLSGADRYDIGICRNVWGSWRDYYTSSGNIFDNSPCIWDATNAPYGTYYVKANFYNDCSGEKKTVEYIINVLHRSNVSSILTYDDSIQHNNSDISVYPNPTTGRVLIKNNTDESLETINVYSLNGQLVLRRDNSAKLSENELDLSSFANGLYLVHLKTAKESYVKSIILHK